MTSPFTTRDPSWAANWLMVPSRWANTSAVTSTESAAGTRRSPAPVEGLGSVTWTTKGERLATGFAELVLSDSGLAVQPVSTQAIKSITAVRGIARIFDLYRIT